MSNQKKELRTANGRKQSDLIVNGVMGLNG